MVCQKILQVLAILLWISFIPTAGLSASQKSSTEVYLEQLRNQGKERVIVVFRDHPDLNVIGIYHAKLIRQLKIINAAVCEIDRNAVSSLKRQPNVKYVIPDVIVRIPEPAEVEVPFQIISPLSYEGPVTVRWNNLEAGLNSQAAWNIYNLDGTGIKIAFLDTGVNYNLANLQPSYLGGEDFVEDDGDPLTTNVNENHGTKVVSLAVGRGVEGGKVVGVAYRAGFYAVKVMDENGLGLTTDIMSGIEWASTEPHKADIISLSLGIYDEDNVNNPLWPYIKQEYEAVCDNAYNTGIILVAASGNRGYNHSAYPAAFTNVISTGGHGEDQTLLNYMGIISNGGVDIVAPAAQVYTVKPDNSAWVVWGTSYVAPHTAALLALQLQYARQNNIQPNNGYLWEVMKHSAKDMPLITDPVYKGKGKIWAAGTNVNDPNIGSIDLMAANWPINYEFEFSDYAFADGNFPVYHVGSDVNQSLTLTNVTNILGNYPENIENLDVTMIQASYTDSNEPNLPGDSVKIFPTITLLEPGDANSITLSLLYTIPPSTTPGLCKTKLVLEFKFVGNDRVIKISYNTPNSLWYAAIPADLDLNNNIDLIDFSTFAQNWQQTACDVPDFCGRADIDQDGNVGLRDLRILAENWLKGL